MKPRLVLLLVALVSTAWVASAAVPARTDRQSYAGSWQEQGLQPVSGSRLDLLYVRAREGGPKHSADFIKLAPVQVQLREDWQRADRALERARLRPAEEAELQDQVAAAVSEEVGKVFAQSPLMLGGDPVLQVRVVDLYLNAPEVQTAVQAKTYTTSFGDMVLVAELRDAQDDRLLAGSWDHRPARELTGLRLTTRVENSTELRAHVRRWAQVLRTDLGRAVAGR